MRIYTSLLILLISLVSCREQNKKPNWISFAITNDSIQVIATNTNKYPFQVYSKRGDKAVTDTFVLQPSMKRKLLSFKLTAEDSVSIMKSYRFIGAYGDPEVTSYDSLFNYQLPFPKHKSYKVLQGNNTSFTHSNNFSRYAIDFRMPIGDTVCASRSGYVAGVIQKFNKNGNDKSFRDYANFITMYHDDGTFSQYVHLKQNGALVKANQFVEQGDPIALSGNTGWSTEPHLHFAVFKSIPLNFKSIPFILDGEPSQDFKKWDLVSHKTIKDHPKDSL